MKSGWQRVKLGEVARIVGGATPSTKREENYGGDIAWISPKDLSGYCFRYISHGERNITQQGFDSCSTEMLPKNAILFSSRAPIGYVALAENELCTNQGFKSLIPDPEKLDYLFGYYLLRHNVANIESRAVGTTFKEISGAIMRGIEISLPPLATQRRIAAVLGALDDKIELNRKMNANLEAQAQSLFKSWFVDFAPWGGKMPTGWKKIKLNDIADFNSGYAYSSDELQPSRTAMATIKNFERNGGFKLDGYKEIMPSEKLKDSQRVSKFDILVAHTDLTQKAEVVGNAELVLSLSGYDKIVASSDLVNVVPKTGVSRFLLAALLKQVDFKQHCLRYVNGSTVLHMRKTALPEYEFSFPENTSLLEPLSKQLEGFYRLMANNIEESRKLAELRDTLLPKLMSGQLEVAG